MQALSGYVRRLGAAARLREPCRDDTASGGRARRRLLVLSGRERRRARQVEVEETPASPAHAARQTHGRAGRRPRGAAISRRANALAGDGDCAAAIEEYTKAYELLDDPVVLFNRAECYRRTGDAEQRRRRLPRVPREGAEQRPTAPTSRRRSSRSRPPSRAPRDSPREGRRPPPPTVAAAPAPTAGAADGGRAPPPPRRCRRPRPSRRSSPSPRSPSGARRPRQARTPVRPAARRPWVWVALSVAGRRRGRRAAICCSARTTSRRRPRALGNYRL